MKHILLATVLALVCVHAYADADWVTVSVSNDGHTKWDIEPASLTLSKNKAGISIAEVTGRTSDTRISHVDLYKWYVSVGDCNNKMGKVVSLNVDGIFLFENDFKFGSNDVTTAVAKAVCDAAAHQDNNLR